MVKIWLLALSLSMWSAKTKGSQNLTASDQLMRYKNATQGHTDIWTHENGEPVNENDTVTLNVDTSNNILLLQALMHFSHERLPNRPVHTKGAGAYGYFEVTKDISDICKANMFSEVGKKTRVAVRFSNQITEVGGPDSSRDSKGFAIKFYTKEGNLDLLGINFPVFNIKEPGLFPSVIRASKPNPQTGLRNENSFWDLHTLRPETVFFVMNALGDPGVPNGFRHMPGFPIHSYQVYNDQGNISYIRFRFDPDAGIQNLSTSEAKKLAGEDPDYFAKDLFEAILNGDYPSWTISIQYMSPEDIQNAKFNPFDVTLVWPENNYPPMPIGKLVLNQNLKNHFAENVLISYNPGNLVPGISGGGDRLFEARVFTYLESANYRLGANFFKIKVNCPMSDTHTYSRDGAPPVWDNEENSPNYFPNSFNGPVPQKDANKPKLIFHYVDPEAKNIDQARDMYENQMDEGARSRLIETIADRLRSIAPFLQKRAINMFSKVNLDFGQRLANGIKNAKKSTFKPIPIQN